MKGSTAAGRRRALAGVAVGVLLGAVALAAFLAPGRIGSAAPAALDPPSFVEEAASAGIEHRYDGEFTFFVGGGVAAFDCDDDARPDLYFAGGAEPAALYRNESPIGGELRFRPVSDPVTDLTDVTGAYPLDVDGDRHTDLVVLRVGENVLLRGLGDCRFERANEALGFDGGDAWTAAFSATWEGDDDLPTLAIGNYLVLDEDGRQTFDCHDNELVRPDGGGEQYAAPVALSPGWCSLSMLFSDWDRSGRRDLRVSNDRHYYRDGEEQLWRVEAGVPPRLWTSDEGWQTLRVFGMGIASNDLTGDGYPEVYLTSQADNKLQTLADGPERPTYVDMALEAGVTAHRPYSGDTTLPSTAWHAEFARRERRLVCRPLRVEGQRRGDARPRGARPEQPAPRPAGRHLRRERRGGWPDELRQGAGSGARRPQSRRDARSRRGEPPGERGALAQRWIGNGRRAGADGQLDRRCASSSPARTTTPSVPGSRCASASESRAASSRSAAGTPAGSWAGSGSASAKRSVPRSPSSGPTARSDAGSGSSANQLRHHRARRARAGLLHASSTPTEDDEPMTTAPPRLAEVELPEFGMPDAMPEIPAAIYAARMERLRERADARGYDRLVVYADREHSANLAYLTGFDPRFEEALLVIGPDGDPAILAGNECIGVAGAAPLPMRRHLFQDFSLPGQPRDRSLPLTEILAGEGIGPGSRVGVVGWKTYAGRG